MGWYAPAAGPTKRTELGRLGPRAVKPIFEQVGLQGQSHVASWEMERFGGR